MESQSETTHYEILGVKATAPYDEIKAAYHKFARQSHPDKQRQSPNHQAIDFKRIQKAWETLRNQDERQRYDDDLQQKDLRQKSRTQGALTLTLEDLEEAIDEEDNVMYVYDCRCGEEVFVQNWGKEKDLLVDCEGCCFVYKVVGEK